MASVENTAVVTAKEDENSGNNSNNEPNSGNTAGNSSPKGTSEPPNGKSEPPKETPPKKQKKNHRRGIAKINLSALKELEGTTTSSFLDLAKAVILIDNVPYDEVSFPMSNARKKDLERLIAHHAQLVIYGKRKYHIKSVISRKTKEELNDVELKVIRERPYVEFSKDERARRKEENQKRYQERKEKEEAAQEEAERKAKEDEEKAKKDAEQKTATGAETTK